MKHKKDAGFSLVEVLVSIVILALVVVPLCTGLVMSVRMNAKADALLQAQLAVSSEIEKLMATGIDENSIPTTDTHVVVTVERDPADSPYYNVTVSYDEDLEDEDNEYLVSVETFIRAVSGEGDGT